MRSVYMMAVLALVVAFGVRAADEENPYKKAKVGDWVEYKVVSAFAGMNMEQEMKQTVAKKTDTTVTIDVVSKVHGQEMKSSFDVDLTKKYDPKAQQAPGTDAEVKEIGKGEESVTVNGKSYKTTWYEMEVSMKTPVPSQTKSKSWISPEVPLGGLVKSENEIKNVGKTSMELKAFGTGK